MAKVKRLKIPFVYAVWRRSKLSKAELARRVGWSRQRLHFHIRGGGNLPCESLGILLRGSGIQRGIFWRMVRRWYNR